MAWHLAVSEVPGRHFAVVNGEGEVAGLHSTREAATIQMTYLNVHDAETLAADDKPSKADEGVVEESSRTLGKPYNPPPIPYTSPTTIVW